jgi:hypothetical protein
MLPDWVLVAYLPAVIIWTTIAGPMFVIYWFKRLGVAEEIKNETIEAVLEKTPEITANIMNDEGVGAAAIAMGDKYLAHIKHVAFGKMGADSKLEKKADKMIQQFLGGGGDALGPQGQVFQQIVGKIAQGSDDESLLQTIGRLLLMNYLPQIMNAMPQGGGAPGGVPVLPNGPGGGMPDLSQLLGGGGVPGGGAGNVQFQIK